jgi:hypothetical protein
MPDRSRNLPKEINQRAQRVVDLAIHDDDQGATQRDPEKDPAAVSLGRRGGLKGGRARAQKLTAEQRSNIARKAAAARYGKK